MRSEQSRLDDACHQMRQPLQSLVLLKALLARAVESDEARRLVTRMDAALDAMSAVVSELNGSRRQTERWVLPDEMPSLASLPPAVSTTFPGPTVYIVDDDAGVREALGCVLLEAGHSVRQFASCEAFLEHASSGAEGCLLVDAYLPGMSGIELLKCIQNGGNGMPAIMITGRSDVSTAVHAMKAGAIDFIEKPIGRAELLLSIAGAVERSRDKSQRLAWHNEAVQRMDGLTRRQHEVMLLVLAGHPSKNIAADLGISQRTVENHRAAIMSRTGATSLPALARLAVAADAASSVPAVGAPHAAPRP